MNLATLALANLRRRFARSAIVSGSVGLAVASALSLVTLADNIGATAGQSADERGTDLIVLSSQSTDVFSSMMREGLQKPLAAISGVRSAEGELVMFALIDGDRQNLTTGWKEDSFFWTRMPLREGRLLRLGERGAVVLGPGAADVLRKRVGDRLEIFGERFEVVGIADYRSAINRSMIYMLLPELQKISFRDGLVTMFDLQLAPNASEPAVEAAVRRAGPMIPTPTEQMLAHDRNIQVMRAVSRSVSLIALVMGALSVLNTLLMAVQERTREIGVMMAIGWSKTRTMASIVVEGVLIGLGGSLIGVPLSYLVSLVFERLPNVEGILTFQPELLTLLPMCAASVAICALGSLYPAWRAASLSPSDALRRF